MNLIRAASDQFNWKVDLAECARIWKGGCIIRAGFLDRIRAAYARNIDLKNLLVDPDFAAELNSKQAAWRRILSLCVASGIAAPAFSSSLGYFDSYRRARLPANLTQVRLLRSSVRPSLSRPFAYIYIYPTYVTIYRPNVISSVVILMSVSTVKVGSIVHGLMLIRILVIPHNVLLVSSKEADLTNQTRGKNEEKEDGEQ